MCWKVEARSTFAKFEAAFKDRKPDSKTIYNVKKRLTQGADAENIWIEVRDIQGDTISGVYDADGYAVPAKKGAPASVTREELQDWMVDDGVSAMGGYSSFALQRAGVAQAFGISGSDTRSGQSDREKLKQYWRDLAKESVENKSFTLNPTESYVLTSILVLQRLHKGNTGRDATETELAEFSDLPAEMIYSMLEVAKNHPPELID